MKIAVPAKENDRLDDHFGHCAYYLIYTTDGKKILSEERLASTQGCGCKSNIAGILSEMGVGLMLAGGIGAGAVNVLNHFGISVIRGCSGPARQNVEMYLEGKLHDSGELCHHHEHHSNEPGQACQH